MRKIVVVLAIALPTAVVIAVAVSLASSCNKADAQTVFDEAVNSDIRPAPGRILHLTTRQYSRVQPAPERPQDPYHLDLYDPEPETKYVDAWFEADPEGNIAGRYTTVEDENGVLVQEESRAQPTLEHIFRPALGGVQAIEVNPETQPELRSISVPAERPNSKLRIIGHGFRMDEETTILEIRTEMTPTGESDNVYQRPFTADLEAVEGVETVEIGDESRNVLRYSVDLLQADGTSVRIIDTEVQTIEQTDGPMDFSLKYGVGAPILSDTPIQPPAPLTYSSVEDVPSGSPVAIVDLGVALQHSETSLRLDSISTAAPPTPPDLPSRDIRTASRYGLAMTTTYSSGETSALPRVLRVTVGRSADLLPLLTSVPPSWSEAEELILEIGGISGPAWLLTGSAQMIIAERRGLVITVEAQNLSQEELVRLAASTEVRS
jgi:hypothetical protein